MVLCSRFFPFFVPHIVNVSIVLKQILRLFIMDVLRQSHFW